MTALLDRSTCTALVITCSDFRFKSSERLFAQDLGLTDDYDLIGRPGGIRSLVQPRSIAARDTMLEEIRLLWSLHQFSRAVLVNHISCRAYDDIATPANELEVHTHHLLQAAAQVETMLAGLTAEPYLLKLEAGELRAERIGQ